MAAVNGQLQGGTPKLTLDQKKNPPHQGANGLEIVAGELQVLKFKAAKGSNPGQKMHGEDTLKVPLPPWAFDTCLGRSNLPSLLLLERSA